MNFCPNCGAALQPDERFCSVCGTPVAQQAPAQQNQQGYQQPYQQGYQQPYQQGYQPLQPQYQNDVPNKGLKVLSFFMPLIGLILYITGQKEKPVSAKAYGKMALISIIISMVFWVIYVIAVGALAASGAI